MVGCGHLSFDAGKMIFSKSVRLDHERKRNLSPRNSPQAFSHRNVSETPDVGARTFCIPITHELIVNKHPSEGLFVANSSSSVGGQSYSELLPQNNGNRAEHVGRSQVSHSHRLQLPKWRAANEMGRDSFINVGPGIPAAFLRP